MYNFLKTSGLIPLSDAVFIADHDKIIKMYIFSNIDGPAGILGAIITLVAKKNQNVKMIANGVLIDHKL